MSKDATPLFDLTDPPELKFLFAEVKRRGFRLNNLFHRMDGQWQANLRTKSPTLSYEFAYGPSPEHAMAGALNKAIRGKKAPNPAGPVPDDERDARQIGTFKEATNPIPADELLGGGEGPDQPPNGPAYFHHPESGCVFIVQPGEDRPSDPLCEEIDEPLYRELKARYEAPAEPTKKAIPDFDLLS